MNDLQTAAARFFRYYEAHCLTPNSDTLFNFLNALHSLNDRMKKTAKENFFGSDEFVALKALRNLYHHQEELLNEVRVIPILPEMPIQSDLLTMCLIPKDGVERAVKGEKRQGNRSRIKPPLKFYGDVANINPAIFNFAVIVFEKLRSLSVLATVNDEAWNNFAGSYDSETANGHSHFVSGDIFCRAGDVDVIVNAIYENFDGKLVTS